MNIKVFEYTGDFAENKDEAAKLRENYIRPAVSMGEELIIDFSDVNLATQSFIHALISDVVRKNGEGVLDRIVFTNCSPLVQGLVETVVQYTLESS